jgi:hypothetical protein
MVLKEGEKIHVIVRRFFERDVRRHFIGEVEGVSESVARVRGYTFLMDKGTNQYVRRSERTRLISLVDAGNAITVLPDKSSIEDARYVYSETEGMVITDGSNFQLEINEIGFRA